MAENYFVGNDKSTCVTMGGQAQQIASVLRAWCPKDLTSMKVINCTNPASRALGDSSSHAVTLKKSATSNFLSEIVLQLMNMSPKQSQAEKGRQQNEDLLRKPTDNVESTSKNIEREVISFRERLRALNESGDNTSTVDGILNSSESMVSALSNRRNSIITHSLTMNAFVNSVLKSGDSSNRADAGSIALSPSPSEFQSSTSRTLRRVLRAGTSSAIQSQSTEADPAVEEFKEAARSPSPAPSVAMTETTDTRVRRKRRIRSGVSVTGSEAPTEYTPHIRPIRRP